MRFQKALFMSNFGIDMGLPEFRVGSYATYLLPFSKVFENRTGNSSTVISTCFWIIDINNDNKFAIYVNWKANKP